MAIFVTLIRMEVAKMLKNKLKQIQAEVIVLKKMEIKPVYSVIAEKYDIDYRTVKKAYKAGYEEKKERKQRISKLDSYREEIVLKLAIKRSSIRSTYNFLLTKYGLNKIGAYSTLKHYIKTHNLKENSRQILGGYCSYECEKGELAQCDWKEDIVIHNRSGKEYTINIFHLVLKFSRYSYIELTLSKEQPTLFRCLINAFEYFGGVTKKIMFDNMTTVVDVNAKPAKVNAKMLQFAKDFNFEVVKCKPRSPQTKGTNEARNKILDWIRPFDNEFDEPTELINHINSINFKMNANICEGTGLPPAVLFCKEKEHLNPLPQNNLTDYYCKKEVKVSEQQLVYYKGSKYSVDKSYIGKTLRLEEFSDMLLLYYKSSLIEIHQIKENQINFMAKHYVQTSIKLANHNDFEERVQKNLNLLDNITKMRTFTISLDEALKSNEKMLGFLLQSIKNKNHFIEFLAAKKNDKKAEFFDELREIFSDTVDVTSFIEWLDEAIKDPKGNIFTLLFVRYSEGNLPNFLNDNGYNQLYIRHKEEIDYIYKETEKQDAHIK